MALMPLQVAAGYGRFTLQKKLSDSLRKSYARSADIACEQVAAIRTVASLNREPVILAEFEESLQQPVHEAMVKTFKSTGVRLLEANVNDSFTRLVWVSPHLNGI
jgi:ATP-binding cassette, subfamily B (MDR/TAP), member 1